MRESRWISRVVPGLLAVWAFVAVGSTSLGAAERPWVPATCPGAARPQPSGDGSWYRLDPILEVGARRGQRLVAGRGDDQRQRVIELAPESFAAGPFGGLVLVGADDGRRSTLSLLDIGAGCMWAVGTSDDVIRRATLAPDGDAIYETRVARETRSDLGIWRRPVAGVGAPVRVLGPIDADARFGRTWSTEFAWSEERSHLAIQSCGEVACRTRVLEPSTGAVRTSSDPELGDIVGLTADRLVVHGACRGLPCPLLGVTIDDGNVDVLHPDAGQAVVVTTPPGGTRVILETSAGWSVPPFHRHLRARTRMTCRHRSRACSSCRGPVAPAARSTSTRPGSSSGPVVGCRWVTRDSRCSAASTPITSCRWRRCRDDPEAGPPRRPRAALTIGVLTALVASTSTGAHSPTPVLGGGWWAQNATLEFRWRAGAEPAAAIKTAIKAAATDVSQSKASKAASFVYDAGGSNPIGYGPGATCGVNGIACFTRIGRERVHDLAARAGSRVRLGVAALVPDV